jgi:hypothetical protein
MDYLAFLLVLPSVLASIHVLASGLRGWKSGSPRLPPGPKPFLIIGNILELAGNQPHRAISKLSKTYGPLMTLKLGSMTTTVIFSPDLAKEMLQNMTTSSPAEQSRTAAEHSTTTNSQWGGCPQ